MSFTTQHSITIKLPAKLEPVIEESSDRLPILRHSNEVVTPQGKLHNDNIINPVIANPSKRPRPRRPRATQRERQRMQLLNQAFENLRRVVPRTHLADYQRLSKIATLRLAIQYIKTMNQILAENTSNNNNNTIENSTTQNVFLTTTGQVVKNSLIIAASQTGSELLNNISVDNHHHHLYEQNFDQDMMPNPVYGETTKQFHYNQSPTNKDTVPDLHTGGPSSASLFYTMNSGAHYKNSSHYNQSSVVDW